MIVLQSKLGLSAKKMFFSPSMVDFKRNSPVIKFIIATKETLEPKQKMIFGDIINKDIKVPSHEALHYFDLINNPKMISRELKSFGYKNHKRTENFFAENVYCFEYEKRKAGEILSEFESEMKKFLKRKPPEEKIDILQNFRYHCLMESRAYRWGEKCQDKLDLIEQNQRCLSSGRRQTSLFKKKFEMLNRFLFETLQEERAKIAQQHSRAALP